MPASRSCEIGPTAPGVAASLRTAAGVLANDARRTTTGRRWASTITVDPPQRKEIAIDGYPTQPLVAPQLHDAHTHPAALVTCSICLRVLRGSKWIDAEAAIRELRSFDRLQPLPLGHGLCDACTGQLAERRGWVAAKAA